MIRMPTSTAIVGKAAVASAVTSCSLAITRSQAYQRGASCLSRDNSVPLIPLCDRRTSSHTHVKTKTVNAGMKTRNSSLCPKAHVMAPITHPAAKSLVCFSPIYSRLIPIHQKMGVTIANARIGQLEPEGCWKNGRTSCLHHQDGVI